MDRRMENSVLKERTKHDLTQEALAQVTGVSRQTIIAIEKGKYIPSVALAIRIAHAFGVRVEDLFHVAKSAKPK